MLRLVRSGLSKAKPYVLEIVLSLCFAFRQIFAFLTVNSKELLGGNADVFYLGGILALYQNRKNLNRLKYCLYIIGSIILYAILQIFISDSIDVLKMFVNISKISLNILLAFFVYDNCKKVNVFNLAIFITVLNGFSTLVAFFFRALWTQNDVINKYDLSRLKLFYLEPSELGFHVIIVIIFLLGFYLTSADRNRKIIIFDFLLVNIVIMVLSKPLGAMGFGGLSIAVLVVYDWIKHNTRQKNIFFILFFASCVALALFLILTDSSIYRRVIDTINGNDSSNWYRITVAFSVMIQSLLDTFGLGIGMGNMRTAAVLAKYDHLGYAGVLANSFPSFITEGGIFAILFIGGLIYILVRKCIASRSAIKWALLTFLLTYQIFGGYFTSTMNWVLYGVILSDFNEHAYDKQV